MLYASLLHHILIYYKPGSCSRCKIITTINQAQTYTNYKQEHTYNKFQKRGLKPISAISKFAKIQPGTIIGEGVSIGNNCIISSGVRIGNNTFVGTNSII